MSRALIIGITGQDGFYLTKLLLSLGYVVHGVVRRNSRNNTQHLQQFFDRITLHYGDLSDQDGLSRIVAMVEPTEVYNLGAMSDVAVSFDIPEYTADVDGIGVLRVLNAVRLYQNITNKLVKVYQASTSELFGNSPAPQNELTPFNPRSPYACAKLYGYNIIRNYRESYGMFACNGILFNHESPMRGAEFVTRKITLGIANICAGKSDEVVLGNLNSIRDWGHAEDYVRAMYLMLQQDTPDDYVISTGNSMTIRDFASTAFGYAGIKLNWVGKGVSEVGVDQNGTVRVRVDSRFFRPSEVNFLCGDSEYARKALGWQPQVSQNDLIKEMVEHDLRQATKNNN